ncbi:MAG: histidine phosphatase family protein [Tetrasphaera sp.]
MTTAAMDRTLILLRHAEAVASSPEGDHERELTETGHTQAQSAGRWLREHALGVDQVLCSTAERTRQTAEGIWDGGCGEADVHFDRQIYNAPADALLAVVRGADDDADVVMLVGHAPGVPALASFLADGQGRGTAHEQMCHGFPPGAFAVLRYSGRWSGLGAGAALLRYFVRP